MRRFILNCKSAATALMFILTITVSAAANNIIDYTAYPPLLEDNDHLNILILLDLSGSMQYPAYTGCSFSGYDSRREGAFKKQRMTKRY